VTDIETDNDIAARWATRLDAGSLDAPDSRVLAAWLSGDERREGALLRAQAVLAYLDRGRALAEPGATPSRRA
jgi:transmembrane sensor